jgi:outer membrane beta-barrel protein
VRRFCLVVVLALGGALALSSREARAESPCPEPDEEVRKGVQQRDFLKRLRAELSVWGGFFASDLLSTSYDYGGALAFYPVEDFGVEVSLLVTPFQLAIEKPLTQLFAGHVFQESLAYVVVGNFLWSPVHFKLRASERAIIHGDLVFALGGGDTLSESASGMTFDAGIGLKIYPNRWLAVRFDLRDYVIVEEAVAVERVTNNLVGTIGLSVFLPGPRPIGRPR